MSEDFWNIPLYYLLVTKVYERTSVVKGLKWVLKISRHLLHCGYKLKSENHVIEYK